MTGQQILVAIEKALKVADEMGDTVNAARYAQALDHDGPVYQSVAEEIEAQAAYEADPLCGPYGM
jgi:hypothetical protein